MKICCATRPWVECRLQWMPKYFDSIPVISIYSSGEFSPIDRSSPKILKLQFDDISMKLHGLILFNSEMAESVIRFADFLIEIETRWMIIHGGLEINRSFAICRALNEYINLHVLNNRDDYSFSSLMKYPDSGNRLVFSTMMDEINKIKMRNKIASTRKGMKNE